MKKQKIRVKSAVNKKKAAVLTISILILLAILSLSGLNFIQNGEASELSKIKDVNNMSPQVTPTPPTSLISDRCSAYTAPIIPSPQRTIYVNADTGNDSNDGLTPSTAWRTIHPKANNSAQAGDLILLRGVFTNQWINPAASGTSTNKITYRSETGQTAILEATSTGEIFGIAVGAGRSHIVEDGLEIRNTPTPFQIIDGANNVWLRNLYVHSSGESTFRFGANNNRLEDSVFVDIGSDEGNSSDAVDLLGDADNNIIVRNYFGNAGHGAFGIIPDLSGNSDNNIFAQNNC